MAARLRTMRPWWRRWRTVHRRLDARWPRRMTSANSSVADRQRRGRARLSEARCPLPCPGKSEISVPGGQQVVVDLLYQRAAVSDLQRPQNLMVLLPGTLLLFRGGKRPETNGVSAPGIFVYGLGEQLIPTKTEQLLVECLIAAEDTALVVPGNRVVMLGLDVLQGKQFNFGNGKRHAAHCLSFQEDTHLIQLENSLLFKAVHQRANVAPPFHQPHLLEAGERVPHHMTLFAKAQHELVFDETLPGQENAQDNIFLQNGGQLLHPPGYRRFRADVRAHGCSTPWHAASGFSCHEEVEIHPLVGLSHSLKEKMTVSALSFRRRHRVSSLALTKLFLAHQPFQSTLRNRDADAVAGLHPGQGPADRRF